MHIIINGTAREVSSAYNLSDIVSAFCKQSKHVLTELNGTIIPSALWPGTPLKDGDTLELVAFVGGG